MNTLPRIKLRFLFREPRFYFEWKEFINTVSLIVSVLFLYVGIEGIINDKISIANYEFVATMAASLYVIPICLIIYGIKLKKKFNIPTFSPPKTSIRSKIKRLKQDILFVHRDRLIFALVGIGIFLPIRIGYYTYVSHFFGTNLGLLTGITLVLYFLIKKKKLGKVGEAIERALIKITAKKWTRRVKIIGILWIAYYGGQMVMFDYLTQANQTDVSILSAWFYLTSGTESAKLEQPNQFWVNYVMISEPEIIENHVLKSVTNPLTLGGFIANLFYHGQLTEWYSHYNAFMFAESLEGYCLFFFDRKMYRRGLPPGVSWDQVGLDNIKTRTFRHKTLAEKILH